MALPRLKPLVLLCIPLLLAARVAAEEPIAWRDVRTLTIEGQVWKESDLKSPFDRLPAKAEGVVRPPVWNLSRDSAGIAVRFVTDATEIQARWTLNKDRLAMAHMPATGVSGVDLYARDGDGKWRWVAVGQPTEKSNTKSLAKGLDPGSREYLLYLPLYNGVSSVEVGVPTGAELRPADPRKPESARPIVFYGTSITHGGCASRPGMVHPAIIGRRLDRPVVNLGFSGNGTMDRSIADLLVEIDAAVFVIDCLPNMTAEMVAERTGPLVKTIRKARTDVPILLVEDRSYTDSTFLKAHRKRNETSRAAFKVAYQKLLDEGVAGLGYLDGSPQLGDDGEATVDGSHPTDLGFMRMADLFAPAIEKAIAGSERAR
ncbi:SGNH/GDSL hydrolase family protein [Paludisphaera soli]|uniref:SGNH/GDSL hydrolase family protein n=1 Tax=Paludisphaera soli TaxID=2712865 RepID=UPI0013EA888B|nr:SGNH/GDSL hydrolase family protein [Paludisphaera soli]